ncbi:unnamed protein product [Linum trigynum]|uniref:Uncharacterized protein n=1 Tax=Linum trigynum TaxID=586398 RepID=A0AAV2E9K6_9ROSI
MLQFAGVVEHLQNQHKLTSTRFSSIVNVLVAIRTLLRHRRRCCSCYDQDLVAVAVAAATRTSSPSFSLGAARLERE